MLPGKPGFVVLPALLLAGRQTDRQTDSFIPSCYVSAEIRRSRAGNRHGTRRRRKASKVNTAAARPTGVHRSGKAEERIPAPSPSGTLWSIELSVPAARYLASVPRAEQEQCPGSQPLWQGTGSMAGTSGAPGTALAPHGHGGAASAPSKQRRPEGNAGCRQQRKPAHGSRQRPAGKAINKGNK